MPWTLVPNVETLGYYRMSLRDNDLAPFCGSSLGVNPSGIGQAVPAPFSRAFELGLDAALGKRRAVPGSRKARKGMEKPINVKLTVGKTRLER